MVKQEIKLKRKKIKVGISTNTLPPRGPVGLNQLISYKYEITSNGKIRN